MQDIFETKNNYYNTRNAPAHSSRNIKTLRCGLTVRYGSYMTSKIWELLPREMKQLSILNELKTKIKIW